MTPLILCALLLLEVSPAEACASGRFTASGRCCRLCPAGSGVTVDCGTDDTECTACPTGWFSSSEGLEPCVPCSRCPPGVPTVSPCSSTQDAQCECEDGFFFLRSHGLCAPCSRCGRGEGLVRPCGMLGDALCQRCGPGTFSEEHGNDKPCQTCTRCSDSEVEIRACLPNSDTLCMDKKLHILSRPVDGSRDAAARWPGAEVVTEAGEGSSPAPGTPKFTPQDDSGSSNNTLVYVSALAAVVLGLLLYVAYKCYRSCKQKQALSKARAAELGTSPEGEKLQSDSGVFLDSHSLQDNQPSKGAKQDSKPDVRLYVHLSPHRQEEVERLLQEGAGRGWRPLGTLLGFEHEQLDLFGCGEAPARTLLSTWAQRDGATLGALCSALTRVDRPDVVAVLTGPAQGVSVV